MAVFAGFANRRYTCGADMPALIRLPGPWPILTIFALLIAAPAEADPFDPLPTYNQSPFAQLYGLPNPGAARLLDGGKVQTRVTLEAASHFISAGTATEQLLLDGETHRVAVTIKYGSGYGSGAAEWGVEIPYLSHSGGFLDSFIEGWHDFFGLPEGGRPETARDQLRYVYQRSGSERLRLTRATRGVGDVRLLAAWALPAPETDVVLRASLKLPTGNAGELRGSGAADLAVWVAAGCAPRHCTGAWRWNTSAGALALGRGDVLPEQQRRLAAFGSFGGGWRAWSSIVLKAELRAHTALYRDTELAPLGSTAWQLTLGGTWIVGRETMIDVAVSEDIRVDTAPDASFLLSLRTHF